MGYARCIHPYERYRIAWQSNHLLWSNHVWERKRSITKNPVIKDICGLKCKQNRIIYKHTPRPWGKKISMSCLPSVLAKTLLDVRYDTWSDPLMIFSSYQSSSWLVPHAEEGWHHFYDKKQVGEWSQTCCPIVIAILNCSSTSRIDPEQVSQETVWMACKE